MNTNLTSSEVLILHLIAYEYSSDEIADLLCISAQTVYTHRANLLAKLDVKNTAGLVRKSIELSLLLSREWILKHERLPKDLEENLFMGMGA